MAEGLTHTRPPLTMEYRLMKTMRLSQLQLVWSISQPSLCFFYLLLSCLEDNGFSPPPTYFFSLGSVYLVSWLASCLPLSAV